MRASNRRPQGLGKPLVPDSWLTFAYGVVLRIPREVTRYVWFFTSSRDMSRQRRDPRCCELIDGSEMSGGVTTTDTDDGSAGRRKIPDTRLRVRHRPEDSDPGAVSKGVYETEKKELPDGFPPEDSDPRR